MSGYHNPKLVNVELNELNLGSYSKIWLIKNNNSPTARST